MRRAFGNSQGGDDRVCEVIEFLVIAEEVRTLDIKERTMEVLDLGWRMSRSLTESYGKSISFVHHSGGLLTVNVLCQGEEAFLSSR